MPRIRSIRPEFWKSEAIACHDMFTRLVFIGLWTYVDDNGVGLDNWRLVAAELFPLEEDFATVSRDVRDCLERLSDAGRIRRYTVDGKAYLTIVNWAEHQKVDRPGKARYPEPDDPRAAPTPPASRKNSPATDATPGALPESSRQSRETPSTGEGEKGRRGEGEKKFNTPALAALDAEPVDAEPVDAEPVDAEPVAAEPVAEDPAAPPGTVALFVVPEPRKEVEVAEKPNAGLITREWIDYCTTNDVALPTSIIKRYGKHIKQALDQGTTDQLIRSALGAMFRDCVTSRPSLFDTYVVRAQQGPEMPPERLSRHQADAERRAPEGTTAAQQLYNTLTRPA